MTAAIILAGGAGSRLGGVDKALLEYEGESLLVRMVEALGPSVDRIVIVGHPRPVQFETDVPIIWTLEDPPGGGPLAGLAAGIDALNVSESQRQDLHDQKLSGVQSNESDAADSWFLALACDQPFAHRAIAPLLAAKETASQDIEGILGIDQNQRTQALTAIYRRVGVKRVLDGLGSTSGLPMRALVRELSLRYLELPQGASQDVDTAEDIMTLGMAPITGQQTDKTKE